MLFEKHQLTRAIQSDVELIAIWGAFQILKLDQKEIEEFIPHFLDSPFEDIKDAGIAKIGELKLDSYAAHVTRYFREFEGQIKFTAAYAMATFPNDISTSLLHRWFEGLASSEQSTRMEFEAATYALLTLSSETYFTEVLAALVSSQKDVIKSSVLFNNLLLFCKSSDDYTNLIDQYFVLRDNFSDAELTQRLVEHFVHPELMDWWTINLSKGYSISSIYEQCYLLLGMDENLADRQYWNAIEEAIGDAGRVFNNAPNNPKEFIEGLKKWTSLLLKGQNKSDDQKRLLWIIDSFLGNEVLLLKTIPKIIELETQFLLSIPLYIILEQSFSKWISEPANYVENIANYYHSTLLISTLREKILKLFFPQLPDWQNEDLVISHSESPVAIGDNKNDIIWSFYRGELLGYDVPWPTIFPNPDYSTHLAEGLAKTYLENFDYFIQKGSKVSIDYALQLFQLIPERRIIDLISGFFDHLFRYHSETLYQTIEYLPDPMFVDLLMKYYEKGELEIARLVYLISEVFERPLPDQVEDDVSRLTESRFQLSGVKRPLRLLCNECGSSYQYAVEVIYVDEGSILRHGQLSSDSIWIPQKFNCKKCDAPIKPTLDKSQMEELSKQSRVDRILKITPQTKDHHFGFQICLIDFPRYNGKTYNPQEFERLVNNIGKKSALSEEELKSIWMKYARLKKSMSKWRECRAALEQVKSLEKIDEEWMFLMGLVNLKLRHFADSRKYFDWIIKKYPENSPQATFTPFVEKSRNYLNFLDSKSSKKTRFKVITGKK